MKMNKQHSVRYGNVTLSQIVRFFVEIIGKDALLQRGITTDSELNDAYKEKGSFLKYKYTDEKSLFGRFKQFFTNKELCAELLYFYFYKNFKSAMEIISLKKI